MKNTLFNQTTALILIVLCLPMVADALQANIEEPAFIQLNEQPGNKALQVSVVRYKPRMGGDQYVDLVGAVHVGDKQYYQGLNELFKGYDAVLYELVAPEGTYIPKGGGDKKDTSWLSSIQLGMKDLLGLSFQMEEIDYTQNHFVHADFTPEEFSQSMKDKGESIFGMVFKMWRAGISQQLSGQSSSSDMDLMMALMSSDRQNALKSLMAKELVNSDGVLKVLEGPEGSTLVAARNQKALHVLKREMAKNNQSFAIFYGAAHLSDFHQRLVRDFDMVPVSTQWLDAWKLK
ncbi:hypothetical protein [Marinicella litoralis]|uniref:TraB family protein n=1 Tax=Marinicella litoralis TaxID=644220 RepID=A0A4R6XQE1_9GAMM|nr:hypothetical protein [Marinicella litoralis]TDR20629.1 hypothetical protein C8D91_1604 [Marinicella litoralis]